MNKVIKQWDDAALRFLVDQEQSEFANVNKTIIRERFQDLCSKTVLDLGCGYGYYTDYFDGIGAQSLGVDGSDTMIQIAKERIYERMGEFAAEESYIEMLKGTIKESTKSNLLQIEKMMVHFMKPRIKFLLDDVIPKCNHNTILFCHHTEYLRYVEQKLKETFPERHIASISGAVGSKRRDEIKQMLKDYNDCILVASYACVGTGLTLNNLCYGILFESFKSEVINMQSIGRGLGLSDMRDTFILYDIIDVFDKNVLSNKLFLQGLAKIKIYQENKYAYHIENINL